MAADKLQYAIGNSASTTLSAGITNTDTSAPLTSDTNFNAKSGEGMVIIDEGQSAEELAYATTKGGGALTIPLVNRGLEGGSAQAHSSGATVKGILSATMWNNVIDALVNLVSKSTGALDTTKVVDLTTAQSLKSKVYSPVNVEFQVFDPSTDVATGDGKVMFTIPSALNGMNLTAVHAAVYTAGTTGTTDVQIRNVTDSQDMLSTVITIDSAETGSDTAAAAAVINTSYDDVATNDRIAIDVDAVSTTAPKGLTIRLTFALP